MFAVVHVDDSFAKMKTLPADQFDVCISDAPYPDHVQSNLCSGSLVGTKNVPKYELPFAALSRAQNEWLGGAMAATKRWVIAFSSLESFGYYQDEYGKAYVRGCVWTKPNAMGQLTGDRPATAYEGIACLHRLGVKKRWNGRGSYGVWSCNGTRGKKGRHPNEKPIDLLLKLVSLFSDRGETVFDPFCGSGAIGEACVRLGRNYVGWDSSMEWVDKTVARLSAALDPVTDEHALGLCRAFGQDKASARDAAAESRRMSYAKALAEGRPVSGYVK
jgi:DNA methylase